MTDLEKAYGELFEFVRTGPPVLIAMHTKDGVSTCWSDSFQKRGDSVIKGDVYDLISVLLETLNDTGEEEDEVDDWRK